MSWFQLAPDEIVGRLRAHDGPPGTSASSSLPPSLPSLTAAVVRGTLGFTVVSVAGFVPWAFFGRWFHRFGMAGELGMYLACALVFVAGSGLLLSPLILGSGSRPRFFKLFTVAFTAYSIGWTAGWMLLGGHTGSLIGLLAGTAAMGWILTRAFAAPKATLQVIAILFVLNAAGYFVGGWADGAMRGWTDPQWFGAPISRRTQARIAMLLWGVCYGLGFGAALGWAFHRCQAEARARWMAASANTSNGTVEPKPQT